MAKYHVVGWVHRLAVINNRNDVICEAASYSMAKRIAAAMNRAERYKDYAKADNAMREDS